MSRGEMGTDVAGFPEVFDDSIALPGLELLASNGRRIAVMATQQLEPGLWVALLQDRGGLHVFQDALISYQPRNEQEQRRAGRQRRFLEPIQIDSGTVYHCGPAFVGQQSESDKQVTVVA